MDQQKRQYFTIGKGSKLVGTVHPPLQVSQVGGSRDISIRYLTGRARYMVRGCFRSIRAPLWQFVVPPIREAFVCYSYFLLRLCTASPTFSLPPRLNNLSECRVQMQLHILPSLSLPHHTHTHTHTHSHQCSQRWGKPTAWDFCFEKNPTSGKTPLLRNMISEVGKTPLLVLPKTSLTLICVI